LGIEAYHRKPSELGMEKVENRNGWLPGLDPTDECSTTIIYPRVKRMVGPDPFDTFQSRKRFSD